MLLGDHRRLHIGNSEDYLGMTRYEAIARGISKVARLHK